MTTALLERRYALQLDERHWTIVDSEPVDSDWRVVDASVDEQRQAARERLAELRKTAELRLLKAPLRGERDEAIEDSVIDAQLRTLRSID